MSIYDYFKEYNNKYFRMKDKLIELKEAQRDFYSLTGTKFTDVPKSNAVTNFGFEEQLIKLEKLKAEYIKKEHDYLEEREKCIETINKVINPKYRTILKLFFIEKKNLKSMSVILNNTYKLNYTIDYIKQIKNKAIKEFEKLINVSFL